MWLPTKTKEPVSSMPLTKSQLVQPKRNPLIKNFKNYKKRIRGSRFKSIKPTRKLIPKRRRWKRQGLILNWLSRSARGCLKKERVSYHITENWSTELTISNINYTKKVSRKSRFHNPSPMAKIKQ